MHQYAKALPPPPQHIINQTLVNPCTSKFRRKRLSDSEVGSEVLSDVTHYDLTEPVILKVEGEPDEELFEYTDHVGIDIEFYGRKIGAQLDSGAFVTSVSENLATLHGLDNDIDNTVLKDVGGGATGETRSIGGLIGELRIGDISFSTPMTVIKYFGPIGFEFIIGIDFMCRFNAIIDFERHTLSFERLRKPQIGIDPYHYEYFLQDVHAHPLYEEGMSTMSNFQTEFFHQHNTSPGQGPSPEHLDDDDEFIQFPPLHPLPEYLSPIKKPDEVEGLPE